MTLADQPTVFGSGLADSYKLATQSSSTRLTSKKRANEMEDDEAPRAKRRFEKISAKFERFSISGEDKFSGQLEMETSDSEDDWSTNEDPTEGQSKKAIVEEPVEESNHLLLNDCLQRYLRFMKETKGLNLPSRGAVQGNELVVWRPLVEIRDPFDDPTMKGRIQEVDQADSMCDGSSPDFIVETGDSESETDTIPAQFDSPQRFKSQIEEITEDDEECLQMECD